MNASLPGAIHVNPMLRFLSSGMVFVYLHCPQNNVMFLLLVIDPVPSGFGW